MQYYLFSCYCIHLKITLAWHNKNFIIYTKTKGRSELQYNLKKL